LSNQSEESPSKRARTEDKPRTEQQEDSDVLMALRPVNDELADDVDLFALDSESESRQLVGSRECAIDVDLSKFNFERLEEKSSQPEHISSQPGRSMDVKKKLQQIESYLSEANEPQESYEHDELPGLLAYQVRRTSKCRHASCSLINRLFSCSSCHQLTTRQWSAKKRNQRRMIEVAKQS
jgi:hypothetical protein